MCYSGKCEFEGYMGECTIYNFKKFEEKYKYSPCFIGGMAYCPEDEEEIILKEKEREKIIEMYYEENR